MAYTGNYGNSKPNWDKSPPKENTVWLCDLKKTDKVRLARLKVLDEGSPIGLCFSYCWIEVNGVPYTLMDFNDNPSGVGRRLREYLYKYLKDPTNNPNGIFIEGMFDQMRWACS